MKKYILIIPLLLGVLLSNYSLSVNVNNNHYYNVIKKNNYYKVKLQSDHKFNRVLEKIDNFIYKININKLKKIVKYIDRNVLLINNSKYKNLFLYIKYSAELQILNLLNSNSIGGKNIKDKSIERLGIFNHPHYIDTVAPIKEYSISSPFGPRQRASIGYIYNFHKGVDFHGKLGADVYAIADGEVYRAYLESDPKNPYPLGGTTVVIKHKLKKPYTFHSKKFYTIYSLYSHLSSIDQKILDSVDNKHSYYKIKKGEVIGKLGHSGDTTFNHVHLETRVGTTCTRKFQLEYPNYKCSKILPGNAEPSINPYTFLDFKGRLIQKIKITSTDPLTVKLILNRKPLIFNSIELVKGNIVKKININTREGIDVDHFNNNDYNGVRILPAKFNSESQKYEISFEFKNLKDYDTIITKDVFGNITGILKK